MKSQSTIKSMMIFFLITILFVSLFHVTEARTSSQKSRKNDNQIGLKSKVDKTSVAKVQEIKKVDAENKKELKTEDFKNMKKSKIEDLKNRKESEVLEVKKIEYKETKIEEGSKIQKNVDIKVNRMYQDDTNFKYNYNTSSFNSLDQNNTSSNNLTTPSIPNQQNSNSAHVIDVSSQNSNSTLVIDGTTQQNSNSTPVVSLPTQENSNSTPVVSLSTQQNSNSTPSESTATTISNCTLTVTPVPTQQNANNSTAISVAINTPEEIQYEPVQLVSQISQAGNAALINNKELEIMGVVGMGYESPSFLSNIIKSHSTGVTTIKENPAPNTLTVINAGDPNIYQNVEFNKFGSNIIESHQFITPAEYTIQDGNSIVHGLIGSQFRANNAIQPIIFLSKKDKTK